MRSLLVSHEISYDLYGTFDRQLRETRRAQSTAQTFTGPQNTGGLWIRMEEGQLSVDYQWTWAAGMPERYARRGVLRLSPGQWGRVRYNGRLSYRSSWRYSKRVFNIGLFHAVDPRVFLDTEPVKVHSQMALLW